MAENLTPEIAKMLGVEVGEEFRIKQFGQPLFRFTETRLECRAGFKDDHYIGANANVLVDLICGLSDIIQIPFEPELGDNYWTFDYDWEVMICCWHNDFVDCIRKTNNCVFRTKEEAVKKRPQKFKKLTGKEWEDG